MNNGIQLAPSSPNLATLTAAEKKKLPFYMVTADPFGALDKWSNLSQDSTFMGALQGVIDLNNSAIAQNEQNSGVLNHVHCGFERHDALLRIHKDDISLIALILSLEGTIRAQQKVSSMLGFLASADLSNFRELFKTVSGSKPRIYHDTVIQMLTWFYEVRYQFYEFDVKSAREEDFRDFERLGGSPDGIRKRVKHLRNGKMYLEIGREVELVFDFQKASTELVICD